MPWGVVFAAAIVTVELYASFGLLSNNFARDWPSAVSAVNKVARVSQFVRAINLPAQQSLHAIEHRSINTRFSLSGTPLVFYGASPR
jgi:fumarate reductase subunit D